MSNEKLGGIPSAVESLQGLGKEDQLRILAEIALRDPTLAEEIKKYLFQFEDIASLLPADFIKLQQACDTKKLYVAFRKVSPDFKEKMKSLVSKRAYTMIWEEVEAIGPKRISDVEEAQREIIDLIQSMAKKGEIALPSKWSKDEYVA